ncbi:MFS transporter [Streptomyces tricolor]|nr:MFS transporter [Streptomyces tricolor]
MLPLLLLGLGNSPQTVGLIAGASTALGLLLGPLVALPADRGARKRVMVGSAAVSALAMGCVALALAAGHPPLGLILTAVLVERLATACFEAAARGTVALVSPGPEQPRAIARLAAADQGALITGPALGGLSTRPPARCRSSPTPSPTSSAPCASRPCVPTSGRRRRGSAGRGCCGRARPGCGWCVPLRCCGWSWCGAPPSTPWWWRCTTAPSSPSGGTATRAPCWARSSPCRVPPVWWARSPRRAWRGGSARHGSSPA